MLAIHLPCPVSYIFSLVDTFLRSSTALSLRFELIRCRVLRRLPTEDPLPRGLVASPEALVKPLRRALADGKFPSAALLELKDLEVASEIGFCGTLALLNGTWLSSDTFQASLSPTTLGCLDTNDVTSFPPLESVHVLLVTLLNNCAHFIKLYCPARVAMYWHKLILDGWYDNVWTVIG